jgi:hypothetical protein
MRHRLGRLLGLAVVLVGLTSLVAYDLAASSIEGRIVEIDSAAQTMVIESDTGTRLNLVADPQTVILQANDSKRLADLRTGDRVRVSYTTAAGTNTATDIDIVMVASPPASDTYARNTNTADMDRDTAYEGADRLPQTASPLPLVGLVGVLLLGLGIAVRVVRMSVS